jgi:pimeloyl-ACP methyl ester carboxylesterase
VFLEYEWQRNDASEKGAVMPDFKTGTVNANGINFTYLEKGEGPLLLCLHGFPDHAPSFAEQLDAFASAGYRVVAPYMRGYFPTEPSRDGKYYGVTLGLDVLALIEALGYDKAVVLGHDYGAAAGYAAATLAPEKISKLVSVALPWGAGFGQAMALDQSQQQRSWYVFLFQTPLAEFSVPFNNHAFIDYLWKTWSPGWDYPAELMAGVKETLATTGVLAAALGYYRSGFEGVPKDEKLASLHDRIGVAPIQVPTLYVHGANDGCIAAYVSTGMEAMFPAGFQKEIVEGAGHFVHLEVPEKFNALVLDFLKK